MKKVVIMRGPSGAGKSTYIEKTFHGLSPRICSADHFFLVPSSRASKPDLPVIVKGHHQNYVYDFDPTKLPEAHNDCMAAFIGGIALGVDLIVVDNTNTRLFEYRNYVSLAKVHGYEVEIIEMVPKTIAELKAVIARNIHRVPADIVMKMVLNFESDEEGVQVSVLCFG